MYYLQPKIAEYIFLNIFQYFFSSCIKIPYLSVEEILAKYYVNLCYFNL